MVAFFFIFFYCVLNASLCFLLALLINSLCFLVHDSFVHARLAFSCTSICNVCPQVFSFMVRYPGSHKFLHWSFVTVLLNDLFGIQCRGG